MIVRQQANKVQIEGAQASVVVGVHESGMGQLSKMLRDQLYMDKLMAPIRELVANATDSHDENGVDRLVEVHIPTNENCSFSVRDFGAGLSHESVFEIFLQYFASTKQNSRSLVGGFGIGAKSPFCLVNEMIVTSWHQGLKNTYLIVNTGGEVVGNLAGSEKSQEDSGLEVRFEVPTNRLYDFRDKFKVFYKRFKPFRELKLSEEMDGGETTWDNIKEIKIVDKYHGVWHKGIFYKTDFNWGPKACAIYVPDDIFISPHPSREYLEETEQNKNVLNALAAKYAKEKADVIRATEPADPFELWSYLVPLQTEINFLRNWEPSLKRCEKGFTASFNKYDFRILDCNYAQQKGRKYEDKLHINFDSSTQILWLPEGTKMSEGRKEALDAAFPQFNCVIIGGATYEDVATRFDKLNEHIPLRRLVTDVSAVEPVKKPRAPRSSNYVAVEQGHLDCDLWENGAQYYNCKIKFADVEKSGKKIYFVPINNHDVDIANITIDSTIGKIERAIKYLTEVEDIVVVGIKRKDIKKKHQWPSVLPLIEKYANSAPILKSWSWQRADDLCHNIARTIGHKSRKDEAHIEWPIAPTNPKLVDEVEKHNALAAKHRLLLDSNYDYQLHYHALVQGTHYGDNYVLDKKRVMEKIKSYYL